MNLWDKPLARIFQPHDDEFMSQKQTDPHQPETDGPGSAFRVVNPNPEMKGLGWAGEKVEFTDLPPIYDARIVLGTETLCLPIAEGNNCSIPFPMTEEQFNLLLSTLHLWKPVLVSKFKFVQEGGNVR